jgi:prolyl-tRNA synthetase
VQTGGWDSIDVLFKIKSRTAREYALGQSHEEIVTPLVKELIHSPKDLPLSLYQIQWKFRDELRAKSGVMRGREFLMKDMYSFHANQADFLRYYELAKATYLRIFARFGLEAKVTQASGGNFTDKISYEYMVLTDAGEDDILYCDQCSYAINVEIAGALRPGDPCPQCGKSHRTARSTLAFFDASQLANCGTLHAATASEAGNVFDLGDKFTRAFDLTFRTPDNKKHFPVMGCYGIGVTRNLGIIAEKYADDKGIAWPESVAPFRVQIVPLHGRVNEGQKLYKILKKHGIEALIDDRDDLSAGAKFAAADLIGCPWRVVLSEKNGTDLEVKARNSDDVILMKETQFLQHLTSVLK